MKPLVWIALAALFLCSITALAAPPQPAPEAASLDQLRQQIFSLASVSSDVSVEAPIAGTPEPRFLSEDDPCANSLGYPCIYYVCQCNQTCGACGVQTVRCPYPGPRTCVCNPC